MKSTSSVADRGIEGILELSADAQIRRREVARDSATFHHLTGAITAYGKTLALLTAMQQREELYLVIGQGDFSERFAAI